MVRIECLAMGLCLAMAVNALHASPKSPAQLDKAQAGKQGQLNVVQTLAGVKKRMGALQMRSKDAALQDELRQSLEELRLVQQALGGFVMPSARARQTAQRLCEQDHPRLKAPTNAQVIDLENALRGAPSDGSRGRIWQLASRNMGFRVSHLKALMRSFKSDDARADALALAYPRTVDPERFYEILSLVKNEDAQARLIQQIDASPAP